jgi:hypothetical protein
MRFHLNLNERKVLGFLQGEEYPLTASAVADRTGLEDYEVMDAYSSLADKEIIMAEDRTAGELSALGREYNLFDDESIDELPGRVSSETEIILLYFQENPGANLYPDEIETRHGLTQEQIERAVAELEKWGYPARSRITLSGS